MQYCGRKAYRVDRIFARDLAIVSEDKVLAHLGGKSEGHLSLLNVDKSGPSLQATDTGIVIGKGGQPRIVLGINQQGDGYMTLYDSEGKQIR